MSNDKQRERLIWLINNAKAAYNSMENAPMSESEFVADFLMTNGVIPLPCKVGDTVWAIRDFKGIKHPQEGIVSEMYFTKEMKLHIVVKYVARGEFGKTVFLTCEEAEAALAERSKDHG